jgi:alkyl sulfatase BDS1-like metallo-beta-lactamase superfamily hydrolase
MVFPRREFTWAAELADYVLANDGANADAKKIKAQALTELGDRQINAIARNYYLSSALYLWRGLPRSASKRAIPSSD